MRSLILAGGGMKIGYQAGCLQVLLDEAGLRFDHVDAASGGCFNAALLANGYSGTEIAQIWRTMNPSHFFSPNVGGLLRGLWTPSIGNSNAIRRVIRKDWRLDFERIRACPEPTFTFNVYNFSQKRVLVKEQPEVDEDLLVACVALIMWFPPVILNDEIYCDAVYSRDANVAEAVRRGADEIWAIWTVADRSEYRPGFLAQYFHIIEAAADGRFKEEWREIGRVNAAIDAYGADYSRTGTDLALIPAAIEVASRPPPGRKRIALHLIEQEVPVHYLVIFSRDRMAAAVESGIADARRYCFERGIPTRIHSVPVLRPARKIGFSFRETMDGSVVSPQGGDAAHLSFDLTISTDDFDALLHQPEHVAIATGTVTWDAISREPCKITEGTCKLLVSERSESGRSIPQRKRFIYQLHFDDASGRRYVLKGEKLLPGPRSPNPWRDTTNLFTEVSSLSVSGKTPLATGVLRLSFGAFLAEMTSFRVSNLGFFGRIRTLRRFFAFFVGQLWDVYFRGIVDYAPF